MTRILLALLALAAVPPAQAAIADIRFVQPERFTDVGRDRGHRWADEDLATLQEHLRQRATAWLPAGDRLEVAITDVDMAGDFEPWRRKAWDVRIIRDLYPPRIALRFRWTDAQGRVRAEGERDLTDRAFLMQARGYASDDAMRFEKALLDRWMRREFARR